MNIYVANLSFGTQSDELKQAFEQFGEVSSAKVITDRETGKSRGFGFVEMPDDSDAQAAIDQLDGSDLAGRRITVNKAKPRTNNRQSFQNRNQY